MLKNSKKESTLLKEKENTMQQTLKDLEKELEEKNLENENIKVQLSVVHAEKLTFEQQLHSVIENNAVHLESLDAKLNRLKGECEAAKRAKSELESEYDNYKTRVHSVLKQQKSKPSTPSLHVEDSERSQLQQNILQLKIKHQETSEKLHSLQSDYEDLETENEKLTTAHAQLSLDSENKERFWKERIEKISQEYSTSFERQKETIEHLNMKNETLSKSFKEKIRKLEEDYKSKIEKLNREIDQIEKEQKKESPQLKLNLPGDVVNVTFEERQAGEGMDNTELEQVNVFSQPTTPASTASLHSVALETLLSPNKEMADLHDTVLTEEEILTARREIEHLSELLRESEATAMRLGEQAKVLKNEIRRLERNQEREEGLSNLEYLKNIIIKFLSQGSNEKEQLIPVLTTMLKLSEDEKDFLSKYARDSDVDDETNSSWSSYLYRWSSVN
ncbi:GRIP and coiled-coil domain-containing protein 2-like [Xenia sp. Carnegie-2017]|uniref:GRIP and coiled-coil domain-containing protein 2-like n=1 Tax=Xenia sp. Carnegie-2017 TaxID=2897299 RepID=UPI001F0383C8|nr:GRIP and coiled-coil domain-containing protein 2-like [Xenia sp. Carnegie-2017]